MRLLIFFLLILKAFSEQIQIHDQIIEVEIANDYKARKKGLMGRTNLDEGHGMLFVYPKPEILAFWMKNTLIPLSIAFFNEDRVCINILDMDPPINECLPLYKSKAPAKYALEVPQGWFKKHGIKQGSKFSFLMKQNQVE